MHHDIGGAVGEEGGNEADVGDWKSIPVEFEKETRMPHPVVGSGNIQGEEEGWAALVELGVEEVDKMKELVIRGKLRAKATLREGERKVTLKVRMDAAGEDGFEHLAEDGGKADRAIGGDGTGRFIGFQEEEDFGGFPLLWIEASVQDGSVEGGKEGKEGKRAFLEVAVGNAIMTGGSVAFFGESEFDVLCCDWCVHFCAWCGVEVLEGRGKGSGRDVNALVDDGSHGVVKVGIIGDGESISEMGSEEVGFAVVIREGLVIMEEWVSRSRIFAREAMEGLPILAGVDG